ncbi:MAG TPA: hypothetical protein PLF96_13120 [Thermotogota bacterium]|nr:hypothetical protein [Thermotogota bacterium]
MPISSVSCSRTSRGKRLRGADKVILHGLFDVRMLLFLETLGMFSCELGDRVICPLS